MEWGREETELQKKQQTDKHGNGGCSSHRDGPAITSTSEQHKRDYCDYGFSGKDSTTIAASYTTWAAVATCDTVCIHQHFHHTDVILTTSEWCTVPCTTSSELACVTRSLNT